MSVDEAARRLESHIDEEVFLPFDVLAGIRTYKGWLADPRDIEWGRRGGEIVGGLTLRKRKEILVINYGYSASDGCGGRDTAIPTRVKGAPALLWIVPDNTWSHIVWPVRPGGTAGGYGLAGTFDGAMILRLAKSMETRMNAAVDEKGGC